MIQKGNRGSQVRQLQRLLIQNGFTVSVDGTFGNETYRAVRAFQSQNLGPNGDPLVVDGKVGSLTQWSLTHPKPRARAVEAVDFTKVPPSSLGGSAAGRAALRKAIAELNAGAREIGGNNKGPFVRKYLEPAGVPEGSSWCASFVSWCFLEAAGGRKERMPFTYCPGARAILAQFKDLGWAKEPRSDWLPEPGDLVFWWRVQLRGWQGHIGFVHQVRDGVLYTIEGNKSPRVEGFDYVLSRMEKLLGFGHLSDR